MPPTSKRRVSCTSLYSLVLLAVAAPLAAQSSTAPVVIQQGVPVDSVRRLRAVVVTADAPRKVGEGNAFKRAWYMEEDRRRILELERGNRALERTLRDQDRQIGKLEQRLAGLKAKAAEEERQTLSLEESAAAVRAKRRELEALLAARESKPVSGSPTLP